MLAIKSERLSCNGESCFFHDCFAADREQARSYRSTRDPKQQNPSAVTCDGSWVKQFGLLVSDLKGQDQRAPISARTACSALRNVAIR